MCNHLSNGTVASPLKRPTWKHDGQPYTFSIRSCFGWGLHGFLCYQRNGSLLHCLSTLTRKNLAVSLCCTIPGVTSAGRYPASCPAKPGLSSSEPFRLFSRDYLAWLRKCYSSTFFCTCKEISFITVHSVLSNVAKIHFKLPAAMEFIAILVNNAFKTVRQSAKDKKDICRRADARQRYLTQDFTLWWAGLRCIILEDCYSTGLK